MSLLHSAPPGSGIGLSQFAIENLNPQRAGHGRAASVRTNGVSGPMTPAFEPPKGTDAPPPGQDGQEGQEGRQP